MPYTPPPGTENTPWERFRVENNIETINSATRPGIMAQFELWKNSNQIEQRYGEVTDFTSPLYQQYRKFLGSVTPTTGTNALLAPLMVGGGNYAASQVQAGALRDELGRERSDFLNTSTNQFGLGMQGQAGGLLGQLSSNAQYSGTLAENQRQFNEQNEAEFFDYLSLGLNFVSSLVPFSPSMNPGGGAGQQQGRAQPPIQPSDRRLKENIEKVALSPNGVNIYEFNYKGGDIRYRGAMADENPEASIERNGIKYLDYSKIDVDMEVV